jgi:hypothetical protein
MVAQAVPALLPSLPLLAPEPPTYRVHDVVEVATGVGVGDGAGAERAETVTVVVAVLVPPAFCAVRV